MRMCQNLKKQFHHSRWFMSSYQKEIEPGTVITIGQFQFTVLEYDHAHIDYFSLVILPTNP